MPEGLSLTRLPYDDDFAWQVQLQASNQSVSTTIDFYTTPDSLEQFGSALKAFGQSRNQEASFEIGSDLGRWAYHIYMRAYAFDSAGHSALDILTDNRTAPPDNIRVHFAIRCDAASLNHLGEQIGKWLKDSKTPLRWTTRYPYD